MTVTCKFGLSYHPPVAVPAKHVTDNAIPFKQSGWIFGDLSKFGSTNLKADGKIGLKDSAELVVCRKVIQDFLKKVDTFNKGLHLFCLRIKVEEGVGETVQPWKPVRTQRGVR